MNIQEAKKILALFRPGSADENDPAFQEARQMAKTDPELAQWFEAHCEAYRLVRQRLQAIPIPAGLKEQILSERKIHRPFFQTYWRHVMAAAAVVALLLAVAFGIRSFNRPRYEAYRQHMTETALVVYAMDLTTNDQTAVRTYLKEKNAPADFPLPNGLKTAAIVGCVVADWQGSPVSMICFNSGRPLPGANKSDLWFFVIDRKPLPNPPPPGAPVFAEVDKATTVSWSDDNKTYLLAAIGDEQFLRQYLP